MLRVAIYLAVGVTLVAATVFKKKDTTSVPAFSGSPVPNQQKFWF